MSFRIIAIDIRHDAAFAVQLRAGMKRAQIEATAQVILKSQDTIEVELRQLVGGICEQLDTADAAVAVSLPADLFYIRRVDFPFRNTAKIRQTLPFEIESTLPVTVEALTLDFLLLPQKEKGAMQPVVAAAIDKEQLASYLAALAEFAIEPELVTAGAWPLATAIVPVESPNTNADDLNGANATLLLLTGRAPFWSIFVCQSQKVLASRNFRLAPGGPNPWADLIEQVRLTTATMLDRGEIDTLPGLGYVSGQFPVDSNESTLSLTEYPNFTMQSLNLAQMHQVAWDEGIDIRNASMDTALALSLCLQQQREIPNFHRQRGRAKRFVEEHRSSLTVAAVLVVLVLVLGTVNAWLDLHLLNQRIARLDRQISQEFKAAFPEVKRIVDPLQQMRSKITAVRAETSSDLLTPRALSVVDIINELSRIIPVDWKLVLTDLTVGPDNMTLSGTTSAFNIVDQIRDRLAGQVWVESAVISAANMNKSGDEVRFKIRVNFSAASTS
jgi:type II secretion system protein L